MHITTANVTDRDGALEMIEKYAPRLSNVVKALVDGGYTGEKFSAAVNALINAEVEVAKRSELHTFAVIPKRWVVERSFGWLEKCRRLWKNCERKLPNTLQMVFLAFLRLLLNRWY
jgi:transposase